MSRRYGARSPGYADERWFTLCNLAVRRHSMTPFVGTLVCAEENALLAELRRRGDRMRYEPTLRVFHARRSRPKGFAQQMFKYGRGRGELIRRDPSTLRAAYLAPLALITYLVLALVVIAVGGSALWFVAPAAVYGLLTIAGALRIAWTLRRWRDAPLAAALTTVVHGSYGVGVLVGIGFPADARAPDQIDWTVVSSGSRTNSAAGFTGAVDPRGGANHQVGQGTQRLPSLRRAVQQELAESQQP